MILLSYDLGWRMPWSTNGRKQSCHFLQEGVIKGKVLSIFIDESGDVGFIKDASKYYIITFVMHNQNDDIKSNIEKIKDYPIFHAGPIIRREYPFDNMEMKDYKKN